MKLILLVPGDSEFRVLPILLRQLNFYTRIQKTKTIAYDNINKRASITPKVYRQIEAAFLEDPDKVILLFDHEDARICPPSFANQVKSDILGNVDESIVISSKFSVVCVNHCFENWILADINVFNNKLFKRDLRNRIGNKSDCKPAQQIIQDGFGRDKKCQKVRHLIALADNFNIQNSEVRDRSPSLDKFLRETGV